MSRLTYKPPAHLLLSPDSLINCRPIHRFQLVSILYVSFAFITHFLLLLFLLICNICKPFLSQFTIIIYHGQKCMCVHVRCSFLLLVSFYLLNLMSYNYNHIQIRVVRFLHFTRKCSSVWKTRELHESLLSMDIFIGFNMLTPNTLAPIQF